MNSPATLFCDCMYCSSLGIICYFGNKLDAPMLSAHHIHVQQLSCLLYEHKSFV